MVRSRDRMRSKPPGALGEGIGHQVWRAKRTRRRTGSARRQCFPPEMKYRWRIVPRRVAERPVRRSGAFGGASRQRRRAEVCAPGCRCARGLHGGPFGSRSRIASVYASSPVEHPADQIESRRSAGTSCRRRSRAGRTLCRRMASICGVTRKKWVSSDGQPVGQGLPADRPAGPLGERLIHPVGGAAGTARGIGRPPPPEAVPVGRKGAGRIGPRSGAGTSRVRRRRAPVLARVASLARPVSWPRPSSRSELGSIMRNVPSAQPLDGPRDRCRRAGHGQCSKLLRWAG